MREPLALELHGQHRGRFGVCEMASRFSFLVSRRTKQDFHFWRVNF